MTAPDCWCGCPAEHHQHYRAGSDCGGCGPAVCHVYTPHDLDPVARDLIRALTPYTVPRETQLMAQPADEFTDDDGDTYVRVDPTEFDDYDDVDSQTITDPGAPTEAPADGGGEH